MKIKADFIAHIECYSEFEVPTEVVKRGEAAVASYIGDHLRTYGSSDRLHDAQGERIEDDEITPLMPKASAPEAGGDS